MNLPELEKLTPRAVIFDLGSTLIEYEAIPWDELAVDCIKNCHAFLTREGHELPEPGAFHDIFVGFKAEYRRRAKADLVEWDIPMVARKVCAHLEINPNHDLAERIFDAYYEPVGQQLFVYDDTVETLSRLKQSGVVIGLISNTIFPERAHLAELKRFGIDSFFDFTIFSSTFRLRKPHADIFVQAANLAGRAPAECVYIGDRYLEDVQGPTSVGMPSILKIKAGRTYPDEMPEATRRIDSLWGLFAHLEC